MATLPKFTTLVERVTCESGVPDKATFCTVFPVVFTERLLVDGMDPDLGLKVSPTVQLAPDANALPLTQVVLAGASAYSVKAGNVKVRFCCVVA